MIKKINAYVSIDVVGSPGMARGIDFLDFLKFIFPTLVVDVLLLQQKEVSTKNKKDKAALNEGIQAMYNISKICALATQTEIEHNELEEFERWYMYPLTKMNIL